MEIPDLNNIDENEVLQCLNCKRVDIAKFWKEWKISNISKFFDRSIVRKPGHCGECGSRAFKKVNNKNPEEKE